jgi:tetratricopeptide (TPR) repeat protein
VVCDKWKAELHHNNENPAQTVFENLIPLCAGCNKLIELQKVGPLRGDISMPSIAAKAFQHFADGNFRQAYACSRVGSRLCETREKNIEGAIEFLIRSLTALRQIGELILVRDVVLEIDRLFTLTPSLRPLLRTDFLARMGCILYDFGDPEQAKPFVLEALKGYGLKSPHLNSAGIAVARSRGQKHVGMVLTMVARDQRSTDYVHRILKDAEAAATDYNQGQAISSALLVQAYQARRDLRWDDVRSLAKAGLRFEEQNDSLSNAMWHYLLGAYWENRSKLEKAVLHYQESHQRFQKGNLMCQPMATCSGIELANPSYALVRLGISCTALPTQQRDAFTEIELKRLFKTGG